MYSRNVRSFTSKSRWKLLVELTKMWFDGKVWRVTIEQWERRK